ncbi:MAG: cupin domain-containing protein [Candidatus Brocadiia bacterium]
MAETSQGQPVPLVQELDPGQGYQTLLGGSPQTRGMRSGHVRLQPGGEIGLHSTKGHEETLVFLEGSATVQLDGGEPLAAGVGTIAYVPPHTGHNVVNSGEGVLRYIYVVAPVQDA